MKNQDKYNNENNKKLAVEIDVNEPVSKLIGKMKEAGAFEGLVFRDKSFLGVFSHFLFLSSRRDASKASVEGFTMPVARITDEHAYEVMAEQMVDPNVRVLPIIEDGKFKKVVDIYEVMKHIASKDSDRIVSYDEMNSVKPDDTIGEVLHIMHSQKLKEIPVVEDKKIIGFVTSKKILEKYFLEHTKERGHGQQSDTTLKTVQTEIKDLRQLKVTNFMDSNVVFIEDGATIASVAKAFVKNRVFVLGIKKAGKDVGVVYADEVINQGIEKKESLNIHYTGIDNLSVGGSVVYRFKEITENYAPKFQNYFNNEFELRIHVKEFEKEGTQHRYQVIGKISYPGAMVNSEATDWDVITALRMALDKLEKGLQSKYKDKPVQGNSGFSNKVVSGKDIKIPSQGKSKLI